MADPGKAVSIHATGQSGHTRTRHHLDFFEKWYRGEFHPHWMDRAEAAAHAEATLRLEPKR
jgi:acyl-homoserine lactone acylase PvdQ